MNNALFKSEQWQHVVFNITLITLDIQGLKCGIMWYRMASNGIEWHKKAQFSWYYYNRARQRTAEQRKAQPTQREQPQSASKRNSRGGAGEPKRRKSQRQQRRQGDKPKQTKAAGSKPQRQTGRQTNAKRGTAADKSNSAAIRPGTESKHRATSELCIYKLLVTIF